MSYLLDSSELSFYCSVQDLLVLLCKFFNSFVIWYSVSIVSQICDNVKSSMSDDKKSKSLKLIVLISAVLIKLFSLSIFSQSCHNSMSSVSNKLKCQNQNFQLPYDRSTCCHFESLHWNYQRCVFPAKKNQKNRANGSD